MGEDKRGGGGGGGTGGLTARPSSGSSVHVLQMNFVSMGCHTLKTEALWFCVLGSATTCMCD